jgi:hypothetical protein
MDVILVSAVACVTHALCQARRFADCVAFLYLVDIALTNRKDLHPAE